jgi:hypothetical protein
MSLEYEIRPSYIQPGRFFLVQRANKLHNCLRIGFVYNDLQTKLRLVSFGLLLNYIGSI